MKKLIVRLAFYILRRAYCKNWWKPAFTRLREYGLEVRFVDNGKMAMVNLDPMRDISDTRGRE